MIVIGQPMSIVVTIISKELRELAAARGTILLGVVVATFFSFVLSGSGSVVAAFFAPLLTGMGVAYYGCSQVFLREKTDFVIETLLCSPVTLRDLWLGKTLGVTLFANAFALSVATLTLLAGGDTEYPLLSAVLFLAAVVPLAIACLVGARGYAQLLLGMRESHAVSLGLLMLLILILRVLNQSAQALLVPSNLGTLALGLAVVLVGLALCARLLSPERIVTSL
jgi:ABC-2 type transport system permease protein